MRALQHVVEQRGLEDVGFALGHGHNWWKIVDNLRAVPRAARAVLELALYARAIGRLAPMIVLSDPICRS